MKIKNIINKKKVRIEKNLIYISYNEKDKPTKINLYKSKNRIENGLKLEFEPKDLQTLINNLSNTKKLKSILLNKDDENLVRRSFGDEPFCSVDNIRKVQNIRKINSKKKNIMKRNIDFIKKVEEKVKKRSVEKNKKNEDKSLSKEKRKYLNKKKIDKKIKTIKKNKVINKTNNKNINNDTNEYIKIDVIQEEEEAREESKHDKKIDVNF